MATEVNGRMVLDEQEKKDRVTVVKFKYNDGPEVQLNKAAAEILEKRGDGKLLKEVKPEAKAPAVKKG